MLTHQMVRRALERVDGAFEMYAKGLTSQLVLAVTIRAQADGLREIEPNAAIALAGLADEIDAADQQPVKPAQVIRELRKRFEAWQKDTLAIVEAESQRQREAAEAAKNAERAALLARASQGVPAGRAADVPVTPTAPAEDKALADALAEVEGLEGPDVSEVDEEIAAMSIEEIERILEETRKKL
jgi:hypothetical protein